MELLRKESNSYAISARTGYGVDTLVKAWSQPVLRFFLPYVFGEPAAATFFSENVERVANAAREYVARTV